MYYNKRMGGYLREFREVRDRAPLIDHQILPTNIIGNV